MEPNPTQFEAENREAEARALVSLNTYIGNGGTVSVVQWKNEGARGQMYVLATEPGDEIEFVSFGERCERCGYFEGQHSQGRQREGVWFLGWTPRVLAQNMAEGLEARFDEF